jgi:acetate kinase
MNVFLLNAGSSSLKFQFINADSGDVLTKGMVDGIALETCKFIVNDQARERRVCDHDEAVQLALSVIGTETIHAVGHRVVHGGEKYRTATLIDENVINTIRELSVLAPLHNPHNLSGVLACKNALPGVDQVAVFDTAFHHTIPEEAYLYAIPLELYRKHGIRKYGFHGTSHKYVMLKTQEILGKEHVNLVTCHLGNGCSIAAIRQNRSIDTTMGFTPLQGLMMGTRSGDIDPEIVSFLCDHEHLTPQQVIDLLNNRSGFFGITGYSDVRKNRELAEAGNRQAILALNMFVYRVLAYIGAYLAATGEVDAIVFTAGIGEGAYFIREQVCERLEHLGVSLDRERNQNNELTVSSTDSRIKVLVIPTNEELMIARETMAVLSKLS